MIGSLGNVVKPATWGFENVGLWETGARVGKPLADAAMGAGQTTNVAGNPLDRSGDAANAATDGSWWDTTKDVVGGAWKGLNTMSPAAAQLLGAGVGSLGSLFAQDPGETDSQKAVASAQADLLKAQAEQLRAQQQKPKLSLSQIVDAMNQVKGPLASMPTSKSTAPQLESLVAKSMRATPREAEESESTGLIGGRSARDIYERAWG